jgi:ribosomal protein L27
VRRIAETDGNDVAIGNIISRQRMVKKNPHPMVSFDKS